MKIIKYPDNSSYIEEDENIKDNQPQSSVGNNVHKVEQVNHYLRKRFERMIKFKQKSDSSWSHPEPFFVHPNGLQIDGVLIMTNKKFDEKESKKSVRTDYFFV